MPVSVIHYKLSIMQPKFTQRKLWSLIAKSIIPFFVFAIITQVASAQVNEPTSAKKQIQKLKEEKKAFIAASKRSVADNDARKPNRTVRLSPNGTEAICATFTGDFAGAPTMPNRLFRPGATSSCTVPYAFPGTFAQTVPYRTFTYTNTTGLTQCGTFTLSTTGAGSNAQFAVYSNSFNPAALATNYLADPGVSGVGSPTSCQGTIASGATIVFAVFDLGTPATGFTLTVDFPICSSVPCSGTPNPGNTIAAPAVVCPSASFTLSLQNSTPGSGVTYLWQSSASSSGPWASASGVNTNATYTGTQTTATWYRCIVTCGANSGTSAPVQVTMDNIDNCYCVPVYANGCGFGDPITRVQFGTLNNASACSVPPYTFYSAVAAPTLIQGATYPLSITVGADGGFGQRCAAWIDYNRDGDFNDAGEFIGNSGDVGDNGTATFNVTIPAGSNIGITRLRVRGGDDNPTSPTATQSCGATSSTFGEAEDYNVNIQPCVPVTSITGPSNVSIQCSQNATFSINIGSASLPTIGWEYRSGTSGPWTLAVNGANINGAVIAGATTTSMTLTGVPSTISGYQFRAFVSNPCTGPDVSAISTLTVTPLIATVNPTAITICRGTVTPLSLTNATSPVTAVFNATTGLPANIPDNNTTGITRTVNVSGIPSNAVITEVRLTFNMTHTWVGDMVMNLGAPNGNVINLLAFMNNLNGDNGTDDFVNTRYSTLGTSVIDGAAAPRNAVFRPNFYVAGIPSVLPTNSTSWTAGFTNAANVNGTWTLALCDGGPADLGVLTSWSITIVYGAPAAGVWTANPSTDPNNTTPPVGNSMWLNAGATIPYVAGTPQTTIYVNPSVNTNYSVVYTTTNPSCTSPATVIPVTVLQPLGTVVQPVDRSVCVGGTTTFSVTAPGGPWGYQWQESRDNGLTWNNVSNGGVYSGATSNTLTLTGVTRSAPVDMNNFLYRCNVNTAPCTGSFTSTVVKLTVNALPTVTIAASDLALLPNQTTTITGSSSPAPNATPNWVWTRDGSPVVGSTSSIIVDIDRLGVYQATVTDVNGCRNSSNQLLIEAEAGEKLWIYPNPTSGQFQIRMYYPGVVNEKRRIQIFNSAGQEVLSRDIMLNSITSPHYQRFDVDLSFQPGGVYLVKVIDLYTKKSMSGFVIKQTR